jgi:acyl-CoA thioester hydrolase
MSFEFNPVLKGVCHPWQCDVMGHLTTRYYMALFDDASYHFLHSVLDWQSDAVEQQQLGWVDVKHVIEYQDEVAAGVLLKVNAKLVKVGGKSITVRYEMFNINKNTLVATLESTCVHFDTKARKAIHIDDQMRDKLTTILV